MKILAIETSCDETAVAIIEGTGGVGSNSISILSNTLLSQAKLHAEFGGVYPSLAKREHAKNLVPLCRLAISDAGMLHKNEEVISNTKKEELINLLEREPELYDSLLDFLSTHKKPDIDHIAVTEGPGLEPALWVGINFAKALSLIWDITIIPINHMEGHIFASLLSEETELGKVEFPALSLLISGGHTELVLIKDWFQYELIGSTRDDAVGEAFDKVARMLYLSYPGGPEIARIANEARIENRKSTYSLPRPMLQSGDCDFSFSGLKTAVLYKIKEIENLTPSMKQEFAREFEEAVVEILITKTQKAIEKYRTKTLILGGGVSANTEIRNAFKELFKNHYPDSLLYLPRRELSTDNAIMIAVAGLLRSSHKQKNISDIKADGNLKIHS